MIQASAPSNIALIKYMGKIDSALNLPTNSSLSYTLMDLQTFVRISPSDKDGWKCLRDEGLVPLSLSEKSTQRFLAHFSFLKKHWNISGFHLVESANNFASDCGLASSASSFAALTKATYELAKEQHQDLRVSDQELALLSKKGSGSSCRSFFSPMALWTQAQGESKVQMMEFPLGKLLHQAVLVEAKKKEVSSSEAHRRVVTSSLFQGRIARAEKRLELLISAFKKSDWKKASEICWEEFWDMHALFETSQPAFGYMEPGTMEVLHECRKLWTEKNDGPIVTMDAGANVHLLWRQDQVSMAKKFAQSISKYQVYSCQELRNEHVRI